MQAAHLVRPFKHLLVYGRDPAKAAVCAGDLADSLGIEVDVASGAADLVARSQLVVTTTPSREPVILADWLHPALHVTAMGSDQTGKNEIDPIALAVSDLYVADRLSQCEVSGELEAALAAGLTPKETAELGDVISGKHPGRTSDAGITIADLTGTGAQDTAIASHVLAAMGAAGTVIST